MSGDNDFRSSLHDDEVEEMSPEDVLQATVDLEMMRARLGRAANGGDPHTIITAASMLILSCIEQLRDQRDQAPAVFAVILGMAEQMGETIRRAARGEPPPP